MRTFGRLGLALAFVCALSTADNACADTMRITEWMYKSVDLAGKDEFVEFTNVGATAIDMTGWSYDDSSRTAGSVDLSAFGVVAPGESVILSEGVADAFKGEWNLGVSVKVIGENTNNLGGGDEINLYDASLALVDRLTYTSATVGVSANPKSFSAIGANDETQWKLSEVGDSYSSYASANGNIGNPGSYPVPEPSTFAMLIALGVAGAVAYGKRRR